MQKNCKKIEKNLQKFCKKFAKICYKKICKIFAEFLQLHILQKFLHFRPREESVSALKMMRKNAWHKKWRHNVSLKMSLIHLEHPVLLKHISKYYTYIHMYYKKTNRKNKWCLWQSPSLVSYYRMLASPAASNGLLDINCRDPLGRSALLMAIDNENLEMVELMLDNKVTEYY